MLNSGSFISYLLFLNLVISDLFNHDNKNCKPACIDVREGEYDLIEKCRIVVGYDDLFHSIGSTKVTLQKGRFWDFTCSRRLNGEASADGAINGYRPDENPEEKKVETDFSLDLTCCDPDDQNCKEVSLFCLWAQFDIHFQCKTSDKAPIIHIGPKADPKTKFFADVKFNNTNFEHKEEHLHIQECTYTEYDSNDMPTAEVVLIKDGCDVSNGLADFKGNYLTMILFFMIFIEISFFLIIIFSSKSLEEKSRPILLEALSNW